MAVLVPEVILTPTIVYFKNIDGVMNVRYELDKDIINMTTQDELLDHGCTIFLTIKSRGSNKANHDYLNSLKEDYINTTEILNNYKVNTDNIKASFVDLPSL